MRFVQPSRAVTPVASADRVIDRHDKHVAYGTLLAVFCTGVVTMLSTARRGAGAARARIPWRDVLLLGVATHKMARIVATDRVTRPLRAPFTTSDGSRRPTGGAFRHSAGELITCPYCLAPWIASGMLSIYLRRPALAHQWAGLFSVVAVSDFSNRIYARLSDG